MATKKSIKSSKTAHVLNVIAGPQDTAVGEEELPAAPQGDEPLLSGGAEAAPAPPPQPSRPLLPPILEDARAGEDALGGKIFDALAQELEASEPAPPPPVKAPAPVPGPEPARQQAPPQVQQLPPQVEQLPPHAAVELPDDLVYVNIMQALVEEKAQKYIDMFGLCTCSRCVADVKAVALTNLPPKYAVMPKGDKIPMLTVYERRYSSHLTAQIIAACTLVMKNPRHAPGK